MASGRPVVATRNGGTDDLVADHTTGRLVPCGDASALAEAMLAYAEDPELRRAHGGAGRERCEAEFAIERCARRYASLLAEIGGRELPPPPPVKTPLEELNV
jgi:glycosyltransferase involved in cell wall biosynthesis